MCFTTYAFLFTNPNIYFRYRYVQRAPDVTTSSSTVSAAFCQPLSLPTPEGVKHTALLHTCVYVYIYIYVYDTCQI